MASLSVLIAWVVRHNNAPLNNWLQGPYLMPVHSTYAATDHLAWQHHILKKQLCILHILLASLDRMCHL